MLIPYLGLGILIFVTAAGFYFMVNTTMLVYSLLMGSPFVKTKTVLLRQIMQAAGAKPGMKFIDLGCGEGVVVRIAAREFGMESTGVDINHILIWRAKLLARLSGIKNARFLRQNIFLADIQDADIIYIFLLPAFLVKLRKKLLQETKPGAVIVSHAFQIDNWERYLVQTIPGKPYTTYVYDLSGMPRKKYAIVK